MKRFVAAAHCLVAFFFFVPRAAESVADEPIRRLAVHLAQANNNSPYAFIRAKFQPGEVSDPWAVRFFDLRGKEVPYFVWDALTWQEAREGRSDWGGRYALLNHHPGNAPEAIEMRPRRIEAAKQQLPELAAALTAEDEAAKESSDSVCAALYLVRHRVPAFGKGELTLQVYANRQIEPRTKKVEAASRPERLEAAAGDLVIDGLPHQPAVRWKTREWFRYAGFKIGDKTESKSGLVAGDSYADPAHSFVIEIEEGLITRLAMRGRASGRAGVAMSWQCAFWMFPEGGYVALPGFSFDDAKGYLGGGLSMALLATSQTPKLLHEPRWEKPWWLHQLGDAAFVAVHQFPDAPLTVGYGNNPFCVSTPDSFHVHHGEKTKGGGDGLLELNWTYELTDPRIFRLFHPGLDNDGSYNLADVTDVRETLLTSGKLTNVPKDEKWKNGSLIWPPQRVQALEGALQFVKWQSEVDWLYRQYFVGVGETATEAENAAAVVLGAAAGWLDRSFSEQEIADLIVHYSLRKSSQLAPATDRQAWTVLPDALSAGDRGRVAKVLAECADLAESASWAIGAIRAHTAAGGDPLQGITKGGGEGWHNNPAYAAVDVPVAVRFLDHFRLYDLAPRRESVYRSAVLEWADFSLATLGGKPFDEDRFRAALRSLWPNRAVMLVPLMLRAHRETNDDRYAEAARLLFDEMLMKQVETNPHGYFWAWGAAPQKAELFDPNYNVAAYDRGLIDFWSEDALSVMERERASQFAAAQARYLVLSGQFLDTWETDSMTAVQSHFPGGIPSGLGQLVLFLYDDFPFYRGLAGDAIRWGVIDDGGTLPRREGRRNFYTQKIGSRGAVYWAYGIGQETPPPSKPAQDLLQRWSAE